MGTAAAGSPGTRARRRTGAQAGPASPSPGSGGDHEEGEAARIRDAAQEDAVQEGNELGVSGVARQELRRGEELLDGGEDRGRLPQLRDEELGSRLVRTSCPGFARRAWSRTLSLDREVEESWPGKRILENR